MRGYAVYLAKRLLQFALVVFVGINVTYLITHATPIDPVEQTITAATSFGTTSPEASRATTRSPVAVRRTTLYAPSNRSARLPKTPAQSMVGP